MKVKQLCAMITVGICLGLLEAAWTTPSAPGATYAGMGCFAIAVVLGIVCWPRLWWVPGLSMLEEGTQVFVGSHEVWRPNSDWVLHHWSAGYFGINLYPVVSFTLITIVGEIVYCWVRRRHPAAEGDLVQSEHESRPSDRT
jgi:hypothetical protein